MLLEAITYRRGHHSTSDDSLRYRDKKEVLHWEQVNNPILRLEKFLFKAGWLTQEEANEFKSFTRAEVLKMKDEAAATKLHSWKCLFENVWDKTPKMLTE